MDPTAVHWKQNYKWWICSGVLETSLIQMRKTSAGGKSYPHRSHSNICCILLSSLTFFLIFLSVFPHRYCFFFFLPFFAFSLSLRLPWLHLSLPLPSHASLCIPFSFPSQFSSPGATVCIHPVAAATRGGHMSGWMNKRPRDPHPQRERERERRKIRFHF